MSIVQSSFRDKDAAVLEAAFTELDVKKEGFLDANEIVYLFRSNQEKL